MYKNNNKSNTDELLIKCDNFLSDNNANSSPNNVNTNPAQVNLTERHQFDTDNGNTTALNIPVNQNISFNDVNLNNINDDTPNTLNDNNKLSLDNITDMDHVSEDATHNNQLTIKKSENLFIQCDGFSPDWEFLGNNEKVRASLNRRPGSRFFPSKYLRDLSSFISKKDANGNTFLHYYIFKTTFSYLHLKEIVTKPGGKITNLTIKNNKGDTFLHLLIKYRKINKYLLNFLDDVHQQFPTIFDEKNAEGLTIRQCLKNAKLSKGIAKKRKNLLTKTDPQNKLLNQKNIINNHLNANNDNDDIPNTLNDNNKLSLDNITDMDHVPEDTTHNNQPTIKKLENLFMQCDGFSPDREFLKNDDLVKGLLNRSERFPAKFLRKLLTYASTTDANGNTLLHYHIFKNNINYPRLKTIIDGLGEIISNLTIKNNKGDTFLHAFIKYKLLKGNRKNPYDFLIELHQTFPAIFDEKDANNLDAYSLLEKTEVSCKRVKKKILDKINEQRKSLNQEDDNHQDLSKDYSIQQTQQFIGSKRLHTQIIEDISNQHLEIDCPPRKKMRLEKQQNNNNNNLNSYFFMNNNKNSISPDVSNSSNCIEDNFQNTDEDIEINNNETIQYNSHHFFQQSNDNVTTYIEQLKKYVMKYNLTEIVEVKPKNGTRYYLKFKMINLQRTSFKHIDNFQSNIINIRNEMGNVFTYETKFNHIIGLVFEDALYAQLFLKQLQSSMANIAHQSAPASKLA